MFGLGWSETLLIAIVALIVVGPKDLPGLFRQVGQFTGKARAMAREFSRAMEAAADEAGVKEVEKTLRAAANPKSFGTDAVKNAMTDSGKRNVKPGGATQALSKERAEARDRMAEGAARKAEERRAREAAEAEASDAAEMSDEPEPDFGSRPGATPAAAPMADPAPARTTAPQPDPGAPAGTGQAAPQTETQS
ncbi:Sec-independent protein translocase protein TatB [Wenxinia saemankumensis]|uniref:Sec-independent protein translocase protein TatB n=1 Tax=Wenxinia saemankumensis TaxID=1447782 RepID=A0A1M6GXI0_9RHOB|nr:Sec-independent protein translocase protein TatB [Wenxinia saemankumensis]SHJ14610.1 sec-independent protein translocase protein TatB [Wenxinia saemankumensis]